MKRLAAGGIILGLLIIGAFNRGAATEGIPKAADPIPCSEEDGSAPDQIFPCLWDMGPNGQGLTYWLTEPSN